MNIKVIDGKAGIEITQEGDRIFIKGLWNNYTSKSKKGNLNMFWSSKELFDKAIQKYLNGDESVEIGKHDDFAPF